MRGLCAVFALILALCSCAQAVDRFANPVNFSSQFAAALPGDRVILAPGTYGHYWLADKHGTANSLIQVIAQNPMNRPVFDLGGASQEGIQIASCSYILFDGLIVQGATVEGIHLESASGPPSNHIIIRNSSVTMPSTSGNTDNWKSDYTTDTLFYNCTANTSGDCGLDFMGCTGGLVMRSSMTTNGNSAMHAKNGSHNMGFYKNSLDNCGERNFQFGGNGEYCYDQIAMGNILKGSPYGVAYTTARQCEFRYNTVVDPTSAVIRILNEGAATPPTGNDTFANNLVRYACSTWAGGPNTNPASFTFANNFWSQAPSLPAPETGGVVGNPSLNADYRPLNPAARDYGAHAPDMEEAWDAYTSRFAWAWSYAQQYEPRAQAGSYQIAPGGSVVFDGLASYAGTSSYGGYTINLYEWDWDGDGQFDDAVGATAALAYADLAGLGLGQGAHDVGLRVRITTELGQSVYDEGWGTLTVVPEPSCVILFLGGMAALRLRKPRNRGRYPRAVKF